ncbi:MAG: HD domain-containing protein [Deltaproteobacteria bacterium]|jgi:hypothetical protein|nr:HD domain-containing protein [Deltaproteobacteria bacterium]
MSKISELILVMTEYERNIPHRVGHFLKVYSYAKTIGEEEKITSADQFVLETAAVVHDIGIKPSLKKYGNSSGKNQEKEGGAAAKEILERLDFPPKVINRVVFLVEHHHTYVGVDGPDYQILLEADFLVNMFEEEMSPESIVVAYKKVFKTETGKKLCRLMYFQPDVPA